MHAIKKAARREAWYGSPDDEVKTYNFFGRTRPPRKQRDEENNTLQHVSTENDVPSPVERRRQEGYQSDKVNTPKKPGTYPGLTTTDAPREFLRPDDQGTSSEDSKISGDQYTAEPANEKQEEVINDQPIRPTDSESKPRKRKMRKFLPWKKSEASDDLTQTDSEDDKKQKKSYPKLTVWSQIRAVFCSWINLLLFVVPVGIALGNVKGINGIVVFVVNFIAIIPLAACLSFATEELAMYIGEVLGGLLNATFGNAVELIVSIIALTQNKILIVQTSLIGSMLSNLLLVMGMCFFFGGINRTEQYFNVTVAQTAASLLALAIGGLIIPTAFKIFENQHTGVAPTSRGTAVLLLVTYACYLFFQLKTHSAIYNEPSAKSPKKSSRKSQGDAVKAMANSGAQSGAATGGEVNQQYLPQERLEDQETPQLTKIGALITLGGSTVLVALCAEYMVSAIGTVAGSVSQEFIGLILLPIVGNAAEHATAVTVAIKDKMDLAIGVAVGSSLQIALLVLPLMVMFSWWGLGNGQPPMTLAFDGFQVTVLFIAVIVVNYLIQDGKSHWLEGVLLQITYLIIAVSAWFYPVSANLSG